ncbi:MAG TPA: metallophosphoesterase [Myxococcaceae bacterium]|nr:metallophosphoesterase [Myxococcaceae bacterium]
MRILHCSDVHITEPLEQTGFLRRGPRFWMAYYELVLEGRARAYARAAETLAAIARDVGRHGVDHLVLSGDLTSSALPSEFAAAAAALGPLARDPRRCTVIPGNHDCHHPAAVRERRFERHFAALLESDLPAHARVGPWPLVRLLGDSAAVIALHGSLVPSIPGVSYGRLGPLQRDGLRAALADPALTGRAVLVVVHHAPRRGDGRPDKLSHRLLDAEALLELLPGPRFAVLHGHIHRRYHHPATDVRPHLFGAGSSTQAGKEGYWLIDVAGGRVTGGRAHPVSGER